MSWTCWRKKFDFGAETVTKSAKESLKWLQMSEVDLLQVHDVEFAPSVDMIVNETLPAVSSGWRREVYVGLSKFHKRTCIMKID